MGSMPIKAVALTNGPTVPSTRFRIKNIVDDISKYNVELNYLDAHVSSYPPLGFFARVMWLAKELFFRIPDIISTYQYDIVIFQRELISTIPTYEGLVKQPSVLDVDDAIWLYRRGWAANSIARKVDHIVCGNQFLADYFGTFGKPLTIIPTSVDVARFIPRATGLSSRVIGWSGTSGGFKFLHGIEAVLAEILSANPTWTLRIVSDRMPRFSLIPEHQLEFVLWSEEGEVKAIQEMDIGLMPLDDTPWSRGKCSYKMLLYMACGLPVVVSDFGMNRDVLSHDFVGFGAKSPDEWREKLTELIDDEALRNRAGANGRQVVLDRYSTAVAAMKWRAVLDAVLNVDR